MRRLTPIALVAALAALSAHARAQAAVYGMVSVTVVSDIPAGTQPYSNLFSTSSVTIYDSQSAARPGFSGGILLDIPHPGRIAFGLDLRGTVAPGTIGGSLFAAGARLAFVPYDHSLRPYVMIGGGLASGHSPTFVSGGPSGTYIAAGPSMSSSNAVFLFDFGLDIRLTPSIDLRAIDFLGAKSHGAASTTPGFLGPLNTAYPGITIVSVGTGLIYRFGTTKRHT